MVAALGRRVATADGRHGFAEALHLGPGVVVVVLALDLVSREGEQPGDGVADGAVPGGGDDDRPGRVRGHHLHLDALRRRSAAPAVVGARAQDLGERRPEPGRRDPEVDEARSGHLGQHDLVQAGRPLRQLFGQLPRWAALQGRLLERDVRRVVPVLGLRRSLELDRRARELGELRLELR